MARPVLSADDGHLEHDVRTRMSVRQKRLLDQAVAVMIGLEEKKAKAQGRRPVDKSQADVMRQALDHLIQTHPDYASVKKKAKGGRV